MAVWPVRRWLTRLGWPVLCLVRLIFGSSISGTDDAGRVVGEVFDVVDEDAGWDAIAVENRPLDVVEAGWVSMRPAAVAQSGGDGGDTGGESGGDGDGEVLFESGWDPDEGYTGLLASWQQQALDYDLLDEWFPTAGEGVIVAVIDSGVDATHPVLSDRGRSLKGSGMTVWLIS